MNIEFKKQTTRAFSLLEVVIAIAVIAIACIPILGLVPVGLSNSQVSYEETNAINLLTAVIQDFRFSPPSETESRIFKLSPSAYQGAAVGQSHKIWIDLGGQSYTNPQQIKGQIFELEWEFTKVPEKGSFEPIEAIFTIRWPPSLKAAVSDSEEKTARGGEFTVLTTFSKAL